MIILANITSFYGQCSDAEHYYCNYVEVEDTHKIKTEEFLYDKEELKFEIKKQHEADLLNKKDSCHSWRIGSKTGRFATIKEIHKALIKKFPKHTIVTYYNNKIFKEMLYRKDGKNLGYKFFGETWVDMPSACYKHLLPPFNKIKIRCECGKKYKIEEVIREERNFKSEGKIQVLFLEQRHMRNTCCKYPCLEWNVIF